MGVSEGISRLVRRRKILDALYGATKKYKAYSAAQLAREIGADIDDIVFDLHVLNARNLVRYSWEFPAQAGDALVNLDAAGFELLESEDRFSRSFPRVFTHPEVWPSATLQLGKDESAMTLNELRRSVLEALYKTFSDDPFSYVSSDALSGHYQVDRRQLSPIIKFLEDEGYVTTEWFLGGDFITRITSRGIRLIEDRSEFNEKFPPGNTSTITNYGNIQGPIQQGNDRLTQTNVGFQYVFGDDLEEMRRLVNELKNISELSKITNLSADIDMIESELKKNQPRQSVLRALIEGAKSYANAAIQAGAEAIGAEAPTKIVNLLTQLGNHIHNIH